MASTFYYHVGFQYLQFICNITLDGLRNLMASKFDAIFLEDIIFALCNIFSSFIFHIFVAHK
jgi:hypothetical protein